jgi:hypothetical protein
LVLHAPPQPAFLRRFLDPFYTTTAAMDNGVAIGMKKANDKISEAYERLRDLNDDDTAKERFAESYYKMAQFTDHMFSTTIEAYDAAAQRDHVTTTYIVFYGDHGEGLWENGMVTHGHRPAQKVIEAPVLIAKREGHTSTLLTISGPDGHTPATTVTSYDVFPTLLKKLTGDANILNTWHLAPFVFDQVKRDGCQLIMEPNGYMSQGRRFMIWDEHIQQKLHFQLDSYTFDPKPRVHARRDDDPGWSMTSSTRAFLTQITDYWDNPLPPIDLTAVVNANAMERCLTVIFGPYVNDHPYLPLGAHHLVVDDNISFVKLDDGESHAGTVLTTTATHITLRGYLNKFTTTNLTSVRYRQ